MKRGGGDEHPAAVTLVISRLGVGGAERVMVTMADAWVARGRHVTLVTVADDSTEHYVVDARVRRIRAGVAKTSTGLISGALNNMRRIRSLRHALREAGNPTVLSFIDRTNVLCLLASAGTGTRVIISVRNDPRHQDVGAVFRLLRWLTYRRAAALVVQTEGLRPWAERLVHATRCHVIENPLRDLPEPTSRAELADGPSSPEDGTILAVGSLTAQKAHDTLIRAFGRIAGELPGWRLRILGEGEERPRLTALIDDLGLSGRVDMPGVVPDPERHMLASDLFVLSSRFEGFPNVLLEAMALGLPVISTDCQSGPAEIIDAGHDGLLVPVDDVAALAAAMATLIRDPQRRAALGARATEVRTRYSLAAVMPKWDALVDA